MALSIEKNSIKIIKASASDAEVIASLLIESWRVAYAGIMPDELLDNLSIAKWAQGTRNHLGTNDGTYLLKLADQTLGVVEVCKLKDHLDDSAPYGEVRLIYLLPDYVGLGLGSVLLEFAIASLKSQGFTKVGVWVLEKNINAIAFYKKHNFSLTNYKKVFQQTGLVMQLFTKTL